MAYLVFARKYRPQQFSEVIGQSHITRTLANAVSSGRLAHAILFSGPRGTGKTTVARTLAKCVNCRSGPTTEPCGQCQSCREIALSNAADVFEIDGASNNKVENVRELRENAKYMPAHSPYKIYIIDEVHMLSDAAFNALLKTLEEPPAHVLFFFATTEPNKIPITILSRCQRHDFRRVEIDAIIDHMEDICGRENIAVSRNALGLIAREADGSIRDALSLLDQIFTCSRGEITDEQIIDILGIIDRQIIFDSADALFAGNMAELLSICDRLYRQGRHLMRFYAELIEHFRNLLVVKMGGSGKALSGVPAHEKTHMAKQVENLSEPYINQVLNTLFEDEWRIRQSVSPRHALEMTFFKLFQIRPAMSIDQLIEKIDQLRQGIDPNLPAHGKAAGTAPDPSPAPGQNPAPQHPAEEPAQPEPPLPEPEHDRHPEDASRSHEPGQSAGGPFAQEPVDNADPEKTWEELRDRIAGKSPSLGACLGEARLQEMTGDRLKIEVRSAATNVNLLNRKKSIANLESICTEFFGRPMRISLEIKEEADNPQKQKREAKHLKDEALNHPLVGAAVKTFNGKIVDIKILPTGGNAQ
ncbi:MAG: DNA polymerase III subunit gamma/tau [Desulfobacterales bacterium]|nr:DNA polymerase III subunit gamma/tau [Desulfobacterales bacterium]